MPRSNNIAAAEAKTINETSRRERHDVISRSLEKAIDQLNNPYYTLHKDRLRHVISKSLSFPKNNNTNSGKGNNGKPHDVETRIALTLYHQWKRDAIAIRNSKEHIINQSQHKPPHDSSATIDTTADGDCASATRSPPFVVTITSDLGLSRELTSPRQLANLIGPLLEEDFQNNPQWSISPDVRSQASGILSLISSERSQMLRRAGRLPCPHCIQWCKGEKGLWWHQQQYHEVEHSSATAVAQATTINPGAMILYTAPTIDLKTTNASIGGIQTVTVESTTRSVETACDIDNTKKTMRHDDGDDKNSPIEYVCRGNLGGLKGAVQNHGYEPSTAFDAKGATPLMWAAGGGHLNVTRYLIEDCNCDPCQPQRGKRSFAGRTALHWAARNGHLEVVRYLLALSTGDCNGNINRANDRVTKLPPIPIHKLLEAQTQDGTTAFGWACWQRHLQVMECLYLHGCDIHALNSYGCSPVLWCSQGTNGNGLEALKWLRDRGCNTRLVNHNGHGVLHKAAQRGQRGVAEWLIREECSGLVAVPKERRTDSPSLVDSTERIALLALVGPDVEGYCPSDLAGMEGHVDFAEWLATTEINLCRTLDCIPAYEIPAGYSSSSLDCGSSFRNSASSSSSHSHSHIWEQYGGLRRIRSAVLRSDL